MVSVGGFTPSCSGPKGEAPSQRFLTSTYTTQKKNMPPYVKFDISVSNWDSDYILSGNLDNALVKVICKYYVSKCLGNGDMDTGDRNQ